MSFAFAADAAAPQRAALRADALAGLAAPRKTLPCKWLYDAEGARLFEAITRLPEYYPTRTEVGILREQAPAIAEAVGAGAAVVDPTGLGDRLGSGSDFAASLEQPASAAVASRASTAARALARERGDGMWSTRPL